MIGSSDALAGYGGEQNLAYSPRVASGETVTSDSLGDSARRRVELAGCPQSLRYGLAHRRFAQGHRFGALCDDEDGVGSRSHPFLDAVMG